MTPGEFSRLRYGMFIHYGLYSMLERGEWVMNREKISPSEMESISKTFNPNRFDAGALCDLAVAGGMRYLVFTTMHHDGFRLFETDLTPYNSHNRCGRNLTAEIVAAARDRGLKIGLYHSLNNWFDQPDGVAALENPKDYERFIANTFTRLEELVKLFNPIDILWYDGWWPFHNDGWQAERMNEQMRAIQPQLLINGRNGLPGDFGTPEGHITAPVPWRPWEACMTLNDHWGYHRSDANWKSPVEVVKMLLKCGSERGNLLLNIGPRGDGSVPEASASIIRKVGQWLAAGGAEAIADADPMPFGYAERKPGERGDWDNSGKFTVSGNTLFMTLLFNPGRTLTLTGLEMNVNAIDVMGYGPLSFSQHEDKLDVELPESLEQRFCPVLRFACDRPPSLYRTGGMRIPKVKHSRYDPVAPDIAY